MPTPQTDLRLRDELTMSSLPRLSIESGFESRVFISPSLSVIGVSFQSYLSEGLRSWMS